MDFTVLLCRSCYSCSFMLLPCRDFYSRSVHVHRMLFSLFIPPISNVEDVIFLHFIFLLWRNCYSCSFHFLLMPKLLLSFILLSVYASVSTLVSFNFAPCRTCYFCSFHLLPMQNLLFSFISHSSCAEVTLFVTFSYLQLILCYHHSFHTHYFHAKVAIFVHFTFAPCRSCDSCSNQLCRMKNMLFLLISCRSQAEVAILVHFPSHYGKVIILVYVIFLQRRFCCSCYLLFCKEKNVFLFISHSFYKKLVIFLRFSFLPLPSV